MENFNEVVDLSVVIANNFDTIDELASSIKDRIKNGLFDKDKYASVITDTTDDKRKMENLVLLNKEYFKHALLNIRSICDTFHKYCTDIQLKRDEKDNINKGRNLCDTLISTDISAYYVLKIEQESNVGVGDNIRIESKKMEEIGSNNNLLHVYLPILYSDISYLKNCMIPLIENNQEDSKQTLNVSGRLLDTITSPETISLLDNNDLEDENNILSVLSKVDICCANICNFTRTNKSILMKIIKIFKALELNIKTQEDFLRGYVAVESLL